MDELLPWSIMATWILVRVALAVGFIYLLIPRLIFPFRFGPQSFPVVERGLWMAFISTVMVHLMAVARLYEAILFLTVMGLAGFWFRSRVVPSGTFARIGAGIAAWYFDLVDRRGYLPWSRPSARRPVTRPRPPLAGWHYTAVLILVVVWAVAAWMRFAEVFVTPAPALSDAPSTIAWTKYLSNNLLYRDGVYPHGMYVFLSLMKKFTALNAVEVIDLTGPLVGFTIVLSISFFTYKSTGSVPATVVAALLYGTLPSLLPTVFERQAAHNSQEYGLIFVWPAAWYVYSYLTGGRPTDRASAAAAAGVAVFTHPGPAVYVIITSAATGLVALLSQGAVAWRRLPGLVGWVGGAAVLAVTPMAVALALGHSWHGSSIEYINDTLQGEAPALDPVYLVTALAATLLALVVLLAVRLRRTATGDNQWTARAAAAAAVVPALLLYQLPAFGVRVQALADRSGEIAALALPVAAALLWSLLESFLGRLRPVAVALLIPLVAVAWYLIPPQPARPYRWYSGEQVLQFLRADRSFVPAQWTLVMSAETGYALAFERAFHMTPDDFLEMARQLPADPAAWTQAGKALGFGMTRDYILFVERYIPLAPGQPPEAAVPRQQAAARLQAWIDQNRHRLPIRQVFNGREVGVWRLELPEPARDPYEIFRTVTPQPGTSRR